MLHPSGLFIQVGDWQGQLLLFSDLDYNFNLKPTWNFNSYQARLTHSPNWLSFTSKSNNYDDILQLGIHQQLSLHSNHFEFHFKLAITLLTSWHSQQLGLQFIKSYTHIHAHTSNLVLTQPIRNHSIDQNFTNFTHCPLGITYSNSTHRQTHTICKQLQIAQ